MSYSEKNSGQTTTDQSFIEDARDRIHGGVNRTKGLDYFSKWTSQKANVIAKFDFVLGLIHDASYGGGLVKKGKLCTSRQWG